MSINDTVIKHCLYVVCLTVTFYKELTSPSTLTAIKVHRLEWLQHVVRMDGAATGKKLLEAKARG